MAIKNASLVEKTPELLAFINRNETDEDKKTKELPADIMSMMGLNEKNVSRQINYVKDRLYCEKVRNKLTLTAILSILESCGRTLNTFI